MREFLSVVLPVVLGQAPGAPPSTPAAAADLGGPKLDSVWDFVVRGGPTMAAIIACSLVALAVIIERLIVLRRGRVLPPALLPALKGLMNDRARALDLCKSDGSPAANILAAALRRRGAPIEVIEKAVEEAGRREMVGLRHRMRVLGALPQVSTMLGLLGTIFGMIKTFQAVAHSGQALGKTELLAKGIFEAWTNTAAGLLVAIPVLVAYHALLGRIDALVVDLDRMAVEFVEGDGGIVTLPATELRSSAVPAGLAVAATA